MSHPISEKPSDWNRLIFALHTNNLKKQRATQQPRHVEKTYPGTGVSLKGKRLGLFGGTIPAFYWRGYTKQSIIRGSRKALRVSKPERTKYIFCL
jgi:hypothetical protein